MKAIIADTFAAVVRQTKVDQRFHADLLNAFAAVYAAGITDASPIVRSEPLTDAEIATIRDSLRAAK